MEWKKFIVILHIFTFSVRCFLQVLLVIRFLQHEHHLGRPINQVNINISTLFLFYIACIFFPVSYYRSCILCFHLYKSSIAFSCLLGGKKKFYTVSLDITSHWTLKLFVVTQGNNLFNGYFTLLENLTCPIFCYLLLRTPSGCWYELDTVIHI